MSKSVRVLSPPDGFKYRPEFLTPQEEGELEGEIAGLPFKEFEFQGYLGKRRVVSFGWRYNFGEQKLERADEIPRFLLPFRDRAAAFASLEPDRLVHVLVTEYKSGTTIGWHRDRGVFGDVVGVSLRSDCTFRFRRAVSRGTWERHSLTLSRRSAYLLRGPARSQWEHSIPPVEDLRYSITFRSLRSEEEMKQLGGSTPPGQSPQLSFPF